MHSLSRNASRLLTDSASRYPERTAIVFGDDRITYEALDAAANRGANLLDAPWSAAPSPTHRRLYGTASRTGR